MNKTKNQKINNIIVMLNDNYVFNILKYVLSKDNILAHNFNNTQLSDQKFDLAILDCSEKKLKSNEFLDFIKKSKHSIPLIIAIDKKVQKNYSTNQLPKYNSCNL